MITIKPQIKILVNSKTLNSFRNFLFSESAVEEGVGEGSGMPIYQKRKKNQNVPSFRVECQHLEKHGKRYTHLRPNVGVKIPYTRFNIAQYTVYTNTLADRVF